MFIHYSVLQGAVDGTDDDTWITENTVSSHSSLEYAVSTISVGRRSYRGRGVDTPLILDRTSLFQQFSIGHCYFRLYSYPRDNLIDMQ